MQSELDGFEYDEDDERIVNVLYCPHCHSDVYCVHPSPNMEKEYEEEEKKMEEKNLKCQMFRLICADRRYRLFLKNVIFFCLIIFKKHSIFILYYKKYYCNAKIQKV